MSKSMKFAFICVIGLLSHCYVIAQSQTVPIFDMTWNWEGTRLAIGYGDGSIEIIDPITNLPEVTFAPVPLSPSGIVDIEWSPINAGILAVIAKDYPIQIFDITTTSPILILSFNTGQNYVSQLKWSPDGSRVATIGEVGSGTTMQHALKIWDAENGSLIAEYTDDYVLYSIDWNPAQPYQILFTEISNVDGAHTSLWDTVTDNILWTVNDDDLGPLTIDWNSQGNLFVTATRTPDGALVRIHDGSSGLPLQTIPTAQYTVSALSWGPNKEIALRGGDAVEIWNPDTLMISSTLAGYFPNIEWGPTGNFAYHLADSAVQIADNVGALDRVVNFFQLVNQDNNDELGLLEHGYTIDLNQISTSNIAIRAYTSPSVLGSVVFDLNGTLQTDDTPSFELTNLIPAVGLYTLTATPYSSAGGTGTAGTPLTINFTIVDSTSSGMNALPIITGEITIIGNGTKITRTTSAPDFRIFRVADGASLTLENLTQDLFGAFGL